MIAKKLRIAFTLTEIQYKKSASIRLDVIFPLYFLCELSEPVLHDAVGITKVVEVKITAETLRYFIFPCSKRNSHRSVISNRSDSERAFSKTTPYNLVILAADDIEVFGR
jgi:hypothetical protein